MRHTNLDGTWYHYGPYIGIRNQGWRGWRFLTQFAIGKERHAIRLYISLLQIVIPK